jgi:phage terminase small subunit
MTKRKLTAQQQKFVNNLLEGMDAKTAYIKAGYCARENAAEASASRLLRNAKVKTAIEEAQKRAAYKAEVVAERILREEMCLAYFDPVNLTDKNGKLLPLHKLPEEARRAIIGFEVITQSKGSFKFKYKFSDKGKSLERLSRHLGMFNDKLNLGFTAETLNAILTGLPNEYAGAVRAALGNLISRS